eukprot:1698022-Pyramimonas_sp.AAC.1
MLSQMTHDLTLPLHDWGVRWKDSSLLYMTCRGIAETDCIGYILTSEGLIIPACSEFQSFSIVRVCRMPSYCLHILMLGIVLRMHELASSGRRTSFEAGLLLYV